MRGFAQAIMQKQAEEQEDFFAVSHALMARDCIGADSRYAQSMGTENELIACHTCSRCKRTRRQTPREADLDVSLLGALGCPADRNQSGVV